MNQHCARLLPGKRQIVAMAARDSLPALNPDDRDAAARQAAQAWKVATVIAAADGMDGPGFRVCMQALGLLPCESWPRTMWGAPSKEGRPQ